MQVNAVSLNNVKKANFGSRLDDQLQTFADLSDRDISKLALQKSSSELNAKKARRINNLIWLMLPVAAGLSSASKGKVPRLNRLISGTESFLGTCAALLTADLAFKASAKLEKSNSNVKEFNKKHPFLAFVNTAALGLGSLLLLGKGASKLNAKYADRFLEKYGVKIAEKLDGSKMLDSVSKFLKGRPDFVKSAGRGILNWAPWLVILGAFGHSSVSKANAVKAYTKNYDELKSAQMQVRELYKDEESLDEVERLSDAL